MSVRYLLDTNICSELIKNPQGQVAQKLFQVGAHLVGINWVVEAELRFSAALKNSPALTQRVNALIHEINHIEFDDGLIENYVRIRSQLTQSGQMIGANDLWIAAHACALDICLVTRNTDEFSRVSGLVVENWL